MSGHSILQIIKGVQKVPGDTLSAEQGLDTVDLLDPLGFSTDTYEMKIPALKSSAVYADSPLVDGRTLISGVLGNVTETIRVTLTAGTIVQMSAMLSKLLRFKQDCNDFWGTFKQIDPIYIKHQVSGEPGPRYALLYDIDIAIDPTLNPGDPTRDLTIVIEREYGWRGIAPGANPKQWTIESNGGTFNIGNSSLITDTDNLVVDTVENVTEWSSGTVQTNKNYVDIPANLIPGDLPALVCVSCDVEGVKTLYISRSTKPPTVVMRNNRVEQQYNNLTAAAVSVLNLFTDTSLATDTGAALHPPSSANRQRANISFATLATNALRINWSTSGTQFPIIGVNTFRGRYAVFARARQTGGAAGDIKMSLAYGAWTGLTGLQTTTEVSPIIQTGTGNTVAWPVTYMGVINLPLGERASVSADGRGLFNPADNTDGEIIIALYARRTTGAGVLYVSDLMLLPIDEMATVVDAVEEVTGPIIYDTTGYFERGKLELYAGYIRVVLGTIRGNFGLPISGNDITLMPKQNNRLYFFNIDENGESSVISSSMDVRVNIIPRWAGLRDA